MSVVNEQTIHLSVNKTLTKSLVSNVKAAGDTGILTQINNNLEEIISDKLSTTDFNDAIKTLQSSVGDAKSAAEAAKDSADAAKDAAETVEKEVSNEKYGLSAIKTAVDAIPHISFSYDETNEALIINTSSNE